MTSSINIPLTGAEDYYLGAWCYGGCGINPFGAQKPVFDYDEYGNPINGGDDRGAQWTVYRYHSESPVTFNESIRVTIEHGHANHRSDNYYTLAYWIRPNLMLLFLNYHRLKNRNLETSIPKDLQLVRIDLG